MNETDLVSTTAGFKRTSQENSNQICANW